MRAAQETLGVGLDPKIDTDPKIESVGFAQDIDLLLLTHSVAG